MQVIILTKFDGTKILVTLNCTHSSNALHCIIFPLSQYNFKHFFCLLSLLKERPDKLCLHVLSIKRVLQEFVVSRCFYSNLCCTNPSSNDFYLLIFFLSMNYRLISFAGHSVQAVFKIICSPYLLNKTSETGEFLFQTTESSVHTVSIMIDAVCRDH